MLSGMRIQAEDLLMRASGFLTGLTAILALVLADLSAPVEYCYGLLGVSFITLIILAITTIRPHWVDDLPARLLHRSHPPA